jgi:hypothetical protein
MQDKMNRGEFVDPNRREFTFSAHDFLRVLSKQWRGEFCRCSINVIGGKQREGRINHGDRF